MKPGKKDPHAAALGKIMATLRSMRAGEVESAGASPYSVEDEPHTMEVSAPEEVVEKTVKVEKPGDMEDKVKSMFPSATIVKRKRY